MPVEYFRWSPPDLADLQTSLAAALKAGIHGFLREADELPGDTEDRIETGLFRESLHKRVKGWLEHFEVPASAIRPYDRSVGVSFGRPQSWTLEIDAEQVAQDIVLALGEQNHEGSRIYRPRILEVANDEVMRWLKSRPRDVDRVHPRSFEVIVAEVIKDRGWEVHLTKQTRDGGYDILALQNTTLGFPIRVLVECKLYGLDKPVGVPMVDRLVGVGQRQVANYHLLITNSRFSDQVWKTWEHRVARDLKLVDREELLRWLTEYGESGETRGETS